jgi:hypothetical protein
LADRLVELGVVGSISPDFSRGATATSEADPTAV